MSLPLIIPYKAVFSQPLCSLLYFFVPTLCCTFFINTFTCGKMCVLLKSVNTILYVTVWYRCNVESLQKCPQCWYFMTGHWNLSSYQYNYGIAMYFVKYRQYRKNTNYYFKCLYCTGEACEPDLHSRWIQCHIGIVVKEIKFLYAPKGREGF